MAIQRELRYGTSAELESFVGGPHELVHDTTLNTVEVHDGNGNSNKMATTDNVELVNASLTDHKNKLVNEWGVDSSTELYPSEKLVKDTIDGITIPVSSVDGLEDKLLDTELNSVADGEVLIYNDTSGKWVNTSLSEVTTEW